MKLFNIDEDNNLVELKEASKWASEYVGRKITVSNISYLLQYGRLNKYGTNGNPLVSIDELKNYYDSIDQEIKWKQSLGGDLNWHLSFAEYREAERTKHVHRLHPYKGKFIPQLVEYFLDSHVDEFKKQVYFKKGDIILDPFCGSGTTLVQANELSMHAIGVDISAFNTLISNVKVGKHDIPKLRGVAHQITLKLLDFDKTRINTLFDLRLLFELSKFNNKYFPAPEYRRRVRLGLIDEEKYAIEKEKEFRAIYDDLVKKYNIKIKQDEESSFLDKWFLAPVREEIQFVFNEIQQIKDEDIRNLLSVILSRTVRSCRATTHADLATLKEPVLTTYYCKKHGKICKPIFTIKEWWEKYIVDTIIRLQQFDSLRTDTFQICVNGDSRTVNVFDEIIKLNPAFGELLIKNRIKGIFSSPPYVGLIDYHDQHAYAYEIFGFDRKDEMEIGALSRGQSKEARDQYVKDIADSLNNCKKFLQQDFEVFLVANDKYNLYPEIARLAQMKIVDQFKRPVLNRVEKDRTNAYAEIIFHLKGI